MDSRSELLVSGDLLEQLSKLRALAFCEAGTDLVLVLLGDACEGLQLRCSAFGETQGVGTPVPRARVSLDQSTPGQVVEKEDEPAREDSEPLCERPLRHSGLAPEDAKYARICRNQSERRYPFRELRGRMRADLGEQERRTGSQVSAFPLPVRHSRY